MSQKDHLTHLLLRNFYMCGSDVDLNTLDYQFIYVYDNEPRNKQIVDRISNQIDRKATP